MMKGTVGVVVTDYGDVVLGPKFLALWNEWVGEVDKPPRRGSKKRMLADKFVSAVAVMALAEWKAGGVLRKTP